MSSFEAFVQLELPKRPYLEADPAQETVMVRRGQGPRQLAAVSLTEKQVLAMVNGQLVGTTVSSLGNAIRKAVLSVTTAATTWSIPHNLGSRNVIIQVFDDDGYMVIPADIQIVDENNIEITFNSAQTGTARVAFLD
jgi:hypothetical protein